LAQALANLDLAVKLDALDPDLLDLRSQILLKMGRTDEAVTDLQNALRFDTYNADLWYRKGWFLTNELQNHKEAVKDLKRATEINPNYARYWVTYASTLNELRDC
jgi:tetratricopeptide (TPR) repeat protein